MSSPRRLVIIGAGGLGRETLWALRAGAVAHADGPLEFAGFVSNISSQHGTTVCDAPVLGDESWVVGKPDVAAICCLGDPRARRRVVRALQDEGVRFASIAHPSARMSEYVRMGSGCVIGAQAVLTTQVELGCHVVVGVNAVVSHDVTLDDFVTLAPGVILAGGATVEYAAELGAGASAIPGTRIGRGAVVGAQAAVTRDVEPNTVVVGVPARTVRHLADEELV